MSKIQDLKSQLNINLAGFRGPASVPAKLPRQMQENDQYLQPNKVESKSLTPGKLEHLTKVRVKSPAKRPPSQKISKTAAEELKKETHKASKNSGQKEELRISTPYHVVKTSYSPNFDPSQTNAQKQDHIVKPLSELTAFIPTKKIDIPPPLPKRENVNASNCAKCNKPLEGETVMVESIKKEFHKGCFGCSSCSKKLISKPIILDNHVYCDQCGKKAFVQKSLAKETSAPTTINFPKVTPSASSETTVKSEVPKLPNNVVITPKVVEKLPVQEAPPLVLPRPKPPSAVQALQSVLPKKSILKPQQPTPYATPTISAEAKPEPPLILPNTCIVQPTSLTQRKPNVTPPTVNTSAPTSVNNKPVTNAPASSTFKLSTRTKYLLVVLCLLIVMAIIFYFYRLKYKPVPKKFIKNLKY